MADDEQPGGQAEAQKHESVFSLGMVRVCDEQRVLVEEDRTRVVEGHTMLSLVGGRLPWVPFKPELHATTI